MTSSTTNDSVTGMIHPKVQEYIDNIEDPERKKELIQFQLSIDKELRKYKDPVARMNKMVELFWEGFKEFNDCMNKFRGD